jgi:heme A synthase
VSAFATYLLGVVLCVVGLAVAAYLLDVPVLAIAAGLVFASAVVLLIARRRRVRSSDRPS